MSIPDLLNQLAQALTTAQETLAELAAELERPHEPDWIPMDQPPDDYGFYPVKMRVRGKILIAYSVWTKYQWVNCFPVQERLGWAHSEDLS